MRSQYDEDLEENLFFLSFKKKQADLFESAIKKNWIIAVPRSGSFKNENFNDLDFLSHVLVHTNNETYSTFESYFKTLTNQKVVIQNSSIKVYSKESDIFKEVQILFDETFYTENVKAYKVYCVNEPLNSEPSKIPRRNENGKILALNSVEDSKSFLWKIMAKKTCKMKVDQLITDCISKLHRLDSLAVQDCLSVMKDLYLSSLQNITSRRTYKKIITQNESLKSSMMLALEMYLCNNVFNALFPVLTDIAAVKDEEINKSTRLFQNIRASKSGMRFDMCENIPKARKELFLIRKITTPLEICECIRKIIAELSNFNQPKMSAPVISNINDPNHSPSNTVSDARMSKSGIMVTSDDLLSALVFLVITSEIPNWYAYLMYAIHFRFAPCSRDDEYQYYLTSLEATLEHIRNMTSNTVEEDFVMDISYTLSINSGDSSLSNWTDIIQTPVSVGRVGAVAYELNQTRQLFKLIETGQTSAVKEWIQRLCRIGYTSFIGRRTVGPSNFNNSENSDHICHPLCSCKAALVDRKSCQSLFERSKKLADFQLIPASKTFDTAESANKQYSIDNNSIQSSAFSIGSVDDRGWNALHQAAYFGQLEIVNLLVEFQFLIDSVSFEGESAIHLAARRGHHDIILKLLDSGADINLENYLGQTALHIAVEYGYLNCVSTLVYFGALQSTLNINKVNNSGNTPLHIASMWGYESIVRSLLDNSASTSIKNNKGQRPVDIASTRKLKRFLQSKANQQEIDKISKESNSTITKIMKLKNTPINSKNNHQTKTSKFPNNKRSKKLDELKDLLKSNQAFISNDSLNKKIEKLLKVVADGDLQMLKFLLEINEEDLEFSGSFNIKQELCHPLCQCAKCLPVQQLMIKSTNQQLNINSTNSEGFHCLHIAAIHDRSTIAKFLFHYGADPNTKTNKLQLTPLHLAAIYGSIKVLNLFLHNANVNINAADKKLNTPLAYACAKDSIDTVESLIQAGALINTNNYKGNTPLHEAVRHNNASIIELLIKHGANITTLNANGLSPLDLSKDLKIYFMMKNALQSKVGKNMEETEMDKIESGMASLNSSFYVDQNTFNVDTDILSLCSDMSVESSEEKDGIENSSERLFPDDMKSDSKSLLTDKCDSPLPDVDNSLLERLDKNSKNNYRLIFKDPNSPSLSSTNSSK